MGPISDPAEKGSEHDQARRNAEGRLKGVMPFVRNDDVVETLAVKDGRWRPAA